MILAIDQGTTGTTVLLVNDEGIIVDRAYREISQHYPKPGWVEHDAVEILDGAVALAKEVLRRASSTPQAIGITNQRETVVLWEKKTGKPVYRAIVWQDRRTAELCAQLREQGNEERAIEVLESALLSLDDLSTDERLAPSVRSSLPDVYRALSDLAERAGAGDLLDRFKAGTIQP